ncbi:MAG: MotB family protein [Mesorhizobium amorphae]|nr:MAG: MotB family protein [Mesorhizobium amorphae]
MSAAEGEAVREIIIVKRVHGDGEEGHHGGAWKIAFADFMTAMMCFFLVMWLINAANEQTKASVASYFNPIKLVDRNTAKRGLEEVGQGPNARGSDDTQHEKPDTSAGSEGAKHGGAAEPRDSTQDQPVPMNSDTALFADPYAVLAEIAADTGRRQNMSEKGDGGAADAGPSTGASGGDAYRDPFSPDFWSQEQAVPDAEASAERSEEPQAEPAAEVEEIPEPPEPEPAKPEPATAPQDVPPATRQAAAEIRAALDKAIGPGSEASGGIAVEARKGGVAISVTDRLDFGMFRVGSAVPDRELVLAMDKIGAVIRERGGTVTVEGHTDARPFRSAQYDNWRLSSARAQAAYHMLVRAGLDERRIQSVAGFADRRLKLPDQPFAAENRRIEILVDLPADPAP